MRQPFDGLLNESQFSAETDESVETHHFKVLKQILDIPGPASPDHLHFQGGPLIEGRTLGHDTPPCGADHARWTRISSPGPRGRPEGTKNAGYEAVKTLAKMAMCQATVVKHVFNSPQAENVNPRNWLPLCFLPVPFKVFENHLLQRPGAQPGCTRK